METGSGGDSPTLDDMHEWFKRVMDGSLVILVLFTAGLVGLTSLPTVAVIGLAILATAALGEGLGWGLRRWVRNYPWLFTNTDS